MQINQPVRTPIGEGVVQGKQNLVLQDGTVVRQSVLVRLPINQEIAVHLLDANCWTPHAQKSGLWLFDQNQVQ